MGHNLNFNKAAGTWSFASRTEKAWHGLGQVVDKAMTAKEAIELANLDYEVQKTPATMIVGPDEQRIEIPNYFATYRTDTNEPLGMVKSRYEVVQNRDAFAFFDTIIDQDEAVFETAGALGKGEKIFITAKLPEDIMVGGEPVEQYLLLHNSHDGTSSVVAGLTSVRVVCNNTLQAALRSLDNRVCISHTNKASDRLREAVRVMGIASKYSEQVQEIFNRMTDHKMTEGQYRDYFRDVFKTEYKIKSLEEEELNSTRLKNMVEGATQFAMTHPTQTTPETNGTLWGAYNAVSGFYSYVRSFPTDEARFTSQFFGAANTKMLKSFTRAAQMMEDSLN